MNIYCSGIGGIGLSAYAAHMKQRGHTVTGSDRASSLVTKNLEEMGILVSLVQNGTTLPESTELLVYSEAVPESSSERQKAKDLGIRQISYFAALGELTKGTDLIVVCGTHGKSSTTAMLAKMCIEAGLDPSVVVGTKTADLNGTNWLAGKGNLWIVEACEYRKSFLFLSPATIILTNTDGDHFDDYKNLDEYSQAFVEFISLLPSDGKVIAHGNDEQSSNIIKKAARVLVNADEETLPSLSVPGVHMQKNAQLVLALARARGMDIEKAKASLLAFAGSWRRMEVKGEAKQGVTVIDDYAHHPVEIRATIAAIKQKYAGRRIVCVFEPHTNDRTIKLWKELTESFRDADLVLVTKVFDARPDKDTMLADSAKLAAEIGRTSKVSSRPSGSLEKTKATLDTLLRAGDVLLIMGAGNSTKLASAMV